MENAAVGKRSGGAGRLLKKKSSGSGSAQQEEEDEYTFTESGELGGKDDEWLGTHIDSEGGPSSSSRMQDIVDIPDADAAEADPTAPSHKLSSGEEDDLANKVAGLSIPNHSLPDEIGDIPDIPDMDDEEDELGGMGAGVKEAEDPASASTSKPLPAPPTGASGAASTEQSSNLLSVRTYDCLITYDKYYQTPRMWLVGYDEHGRLLKPSQIFEDVSSDYAQKTVTIEPFPHSATMSTASIHPCKHASVMKKVIERMNASVVEVQRKAKANGGSAKKKGWSLPGAVKKVTKSGTSSEGTASPATGEGAAQDGEETEVEGLRVDQYMLIFLKFMASIVPAIELDATQAM